MERKASLSQLAQVGGSLRQKLCGPLVDLYVNQQSPSKCTGRTDPEPSSDWLVRRPPLRGLVEP